MYAIMQMVTMWQYTIQQKSYNTHNYGVHYTHYIHTCMYTQHNVHMHTDRHKHKQTHTHRHTHTTLSLLCPTLANTSYFTLPVASTCNGTTSVDGPYIMTTAHAHTHK